MSAIVFVAEAATLGFFAVFGLALASDGLRGPAFAIQSDDAVGRALIRAVQAAFVIGYGVFFAVSIAMALAAL